MADIFDSLSNNKGDIFDHYAANPEITKGYPSVKEGQRQMQLAKIEKIRAQFNATPSALIGSAMNKTFNLSGLLAPVEKTLISYPAQGINKMITGKEQPINSVLSGLVNYPKNNEIAGSALQTLSFVPGVGNLARGAVAGASFMGGQAIAEGQSPAGVVGNAAIGAVIPPFIGAVAPAVSKLPDILNSMKTLPQKLSGNYVNETLIPKVNKMYEDVVSKFTPSIQNFANKALKIPQEIVDHIQQRSPKMIQASSNGLKDSHDTLFQMAENGMGNKKIEVTKSYDNSLSGLKDEDSIDSPDTFKTMGAILKKYKYINNNGEENKMALSVDRNPILGKINDIYQSMKPKNVLADRLESGQLNLTKDQLISKIRDSGEYRPDSLNNIAKKLGVTENDVITNNSISKKAIIDSLNSIQRERLGSLNYIPLNKSQWGLFRDELSSMRSRAFATSPALSKDVTTALDALHNDAESAGLSGIKEARKLAEEYFKHEKIAAPFGEKKLTNVFKMTGEEQRNLDKLEKYIGVNLTTPAKDIVANESLNKIKSLPTQIEDSANPFTSPRQTSLEDISHFLKAGKAKQVQRNFENILGKSKELDSVFNDLRFKRWQGVGITSAGTLGGLLIKKQLNDLKK